jgi:hypothetical protein
VFAVCRKTHRCETLCNAKLGVDKGSRGSGVAGVKSGNISRFNAVRGLPRSLEADAPTVPLFHITSAIRHSRQQVSLHKARAVRAE